jgi:hypothetical protein
VELKLFKYCLTIKIIFMKNQKLKDLSKKVTVSQITSLSSEAVKTISGGKLPPESGDCPGDNGCWGFGHSSCGTSNSCWGYN